MNGGADSQGYTIIEVMIFLAISGLMFVMSALLISGKQAVTQFQEGANQLNTQVEAVINDVSNGYYPQLTSFNCTATALGHPVITGASSTQGTNNGCTFLGKILQFLPYNGSTQVYNIWSIAGRQYKPGFVNLISELASSYTQSEGQVVPQLTVPQSDDQGVYVTGVYDNGTPIQAIGFFGSVQDFGANGNIASGSQTVTLLSIPGSGASKSTAGMKTYLNANLPTNADGWVEPNPDIVVCLAGNGNRYGYITIGSNAGGNSTNTGRLTTNLQITGVTHSPPC